MEETMDFTDGSQPPNPDANGLGVCGAGKIRVGYVSEVNGLDAVEVEGFVATKHELLQLLKYWGAVAIDIDYECFIFQDSGSDDWRKSAFAHRRCQRIATFLGEEAVGAAIEEVKAEMAMKGNPRWWDIYWNGTHAQKQALETEIEQELSGERNERS
jgi:hypothetical protein